MKCTECNYYWQGENESYPHCHFEAIADWDVAPCEYEESSDDSYEDLYEALAY